MKLNALTVSNFKCFGEDQEVDFTKLENDILVTAVNLDSNGMDSNEGGKSSLLEAITWCLFGDFPGMVSADSVIRKGCDYCNVIVRFDNGIGVDRARGRDDKHLQLVIDNEGSLFKTDTITQQEILKRLGFDHNLKMSVILSEFYNRVFLSPFVLKSFVSTSSSSLDRMNMIMRFLGLGNADKVKELIRSEIGDYKKKIITVSDDCSILASEYEMLSKCIMDYDDQLDKLNADLKKYADKKLESERKQHLESEVRIAQTDLNKEEELSLSKRDFLRKVYKKAKEELNGFDYIRNEIGELHFDQNKFDILIEERIGVNTKVAEKTNQVIDLRHEIARIEEDILDLETESRNIQKCPECGTDLASVDNKIMKYDVKVLAKKIGERKNELEKLESKLEDLEGDQKIEVNKLNELNEDVDAFERVDRKIIELKDKLSSEDEVKSKIADINEQGLAEKKKFDEAKVEYMRVILESQQHLKTLKIDETAEEKYDELDAQIQAISTEKAVAESKVEDLHKRIEKANEVEQENDKANSEVAFRESSLTLLGDGVKYAIKQFLPLFQSAVNKYLDYFDSGFSIEPEIDFKSVRDSFKIWVDENGERYLFDERSRGAQTRIAMSVGMSFIELANMKTSPLKLFMADEVVDSLDNTGIDLFFDSVLNCDEMNDVQKLVVSHDSSLKNKFGSMITSVKENGVARIEQ